jgi:Leucine Rich repeat
LSKFDSCSDGVHVAQVSSLHWLHVPLLTHLRLQNCGHLDDQGLQALARSPQLQCIDISWRGVANPGQAGRGASGSGLLSLSQLTQLKKFAFDGVTAGSYGMAALGSVLGRRRFVGLPADLQLWSVPLQHLSFAGCSHLQDRNLAAIKTLSNTLTMLSLACCRSLTGRGFAAIAACTKLQRLDLSECPNLLNEALLKLTGSAHPAGDQQAHRPRYFGTRSSLFSTWGYLKAPASSMLPRTRQVRTSLQLEEHLWSRWSTTDNVQQWVRPNLDHWQVTRHRSSCAAYNLPLPCRRSQLALMLPYIQLPWQC